ncbi:MAG: ComEA family DNA-binding protein [Pseudomonadota bacterium]
MSAENTASNQTIFTVLACAPGALIFSHDKPLTVEATYPDCVLSIEVRSRRVSIPNVSKPIKFGIQVAITGPAKKPEAAIDKFLPPASGVLAALAFAMNASVGELEPEIAFDSTRGREARPFLCNYLPASEFVPIPPRRANPDLVIAILRALAEHPRADHLHISVVHYSHALQYWRPGHDTLALSHLWKGVEALTPIVLDAYIEKRGGTRDQLIDEWGIDRKALTSEARRRLIFFGDSDTYKKAHSARIGYEHGFENLSAIFSKSQSVTERVASFLRKAILETLALDHGVRETLLALPYSKALALHLAEYMRGLLLTPRGVLGPPHGLYPDIRWVKVFRDGVAESLDRDAVEQANQVTICGGPDGMRVANLNFEAWAQRGVGDAGRVSAAEPQAFQVSRKETGLYSTSLGGEKIDINTAKAEALMNINGIGEVRAKAVIKGRPYARKDELVQRKIIPESVYDEIKEQIIARQR